MTEEERERLKQIQRWRINYVSANRDAYVDLSRAFSEIDFLLSLFDSQAIGEGCGQCGGPHNFDTSIPSVVWNQVIRARGLPDYLCTTCIVREFARAGQGFTATLWNEEFNGIPIEVVINGQNAKDASLIQEENNSLRNQINDAAQSIVNEADKVAQLMQSAATAIHNACVEKVKEMRDRFQRAADSSSLPNDLTASRDAAAANALTRLLVELESLTLDQVEQMQQPVAHRRDCGMPDCFVCYGGKS